MAPLAEVGGFLGGLEGLGQQVGSHFLLPPAGERPPLLGERLGTAERGARGGPGAAELAHLHGILRRRQLYCRTGFHLQILPDGSVQGTRQDHSLFGTYPYPRSLLPPPPATCPSSPRAPANSPALGDRAARDQSSCDPSSAGGGQGLKGGPVQGLGGLFPVT